MRTIEINLSDEDFATLEQKAKDKKIELGELIGQLLMRGLWLDETIADSKKKLVLEDKGVRQRLSPL